MEGEEDLEISDSPESPDPDRKRKYSDIEITDSSSEGEPEWNLESTDSESDFEDEDWDEKTVVIPREERANAIVGYQVTSLDDSSTTNGVPTKQIKLIDKILKNNYLSEEEFVKSIQENWQENTSLKTNTLEILTNPFKLCIIDDFIENKFVTEEIRKELNVSKWNRRSTDLYEYFQTGDFVHTESLFLKSVHDFLQFDVMPWVEKVTGLTLTKISVAASIYTDTDYLLVHDDLEENRAIAFILYLTDPPMDSSVEEYWTPEMGGALELFSKDKSGQPLDCVKQIFPKNNRFVFFPVTNDSYHQVSEVLNMDHCRMSINGWFHTAHENPYKAPELELPDKGIFGTERFSPLETSITVDDWVSEKYTIRQNKEQIQSHIELESEMSLRGFLKPDKFQSVSEALRSDELKWNWIGPPNRKKYEVLCTDDVPSIIGDIIKLFQSKSMFSLLRDYTDLDFESESPEQVPTLRYELQRWSAGCYSIFSEYQWEAETEVDLIMYFSDSESIKLVGGETVYVTTEDEVADVLVSLQTTPNTLNIVCRDTHRLVKYVSKRSVNKYFYAIVCSYKEF